MAVPGKDSTFLDLGEVLDYVSDATLCRMDTHFD